MPTRFPDSRQLLVLGILGLAAPQASAWYPVYDHTAWVDRTKQFAETIHKWDELLGKAEKQFQTARQTYALVHGLTTGIKDWRSLGWVEALAMFELPFFDGVQGIDDLRDLAAGTALGVERLQAIYQEASLLQRLMKDPYYRENRAFAERARFMYRLQARQMHRQVVFMRHYREGEFEHARLTNQLRIVQTQLENLSARDPAPLAAIAALQVKAGIIQARIQDNRVIQERLRQQAQADSEQDIRRTQSQLGVQRLDAAKAYWQAVGQFWSTFR